MYEPAIDGRRRAAACSSTFLAAALGAALASSGCGGGDKAPISLGVGASASLEGGDEVLFAFTAADASPLLATVDPRVAGLVLEVIDEATGSVIGNGNVQGNLLVAAFTPAAGAALCIRVENTADAAFAGTLTLQPAPTATLLTINGPAAGDGLVLRLQNDFGVDLVLCQQAIATPNPGSGTWTFFFDEMDLAGEPLVVGVTLLDSTAAPNSVIAFGSTTLPATSGLVETASVTLAASGGMPTPTQPCPDPGMITGIVPGGTYGTSDLR